MGEIVQSVRVNGVRVNALFDSGADVNYLSERIAKKVRLFMRQKVKFMGADGLPHVGRFADIGIDILNRYGTTQVIVTDILPRDGFDLFLGQSFLQDNEVTLDFKNDRMFFSGHQPRNKKLPRM